MNIPNKIIKVKLGMPKRLRENEEIEYISNLEI